MVCDTCGGRMVGDGVTVVVHCEHLAAPLVAPDSAPVMCDVHPHELHRFEDEGGPAPADEN